MRLIFPAALTPMPTSRVRMPPSRIFGLVRGSMKIATPRKLPGLSWAMKNSGCLSSG